MSHITFEQSKAATAEQPLPLRKDSWDDLRSYQHKQLEVLRGGVNICFLFFIPIAAACLIMVYVHDMLLPSAISISLALVAALWGWHVLGRLSYLQMRILLWRCPRCQHLFSVSRVFQGKKGMKTSCGHCGAGDPNEANVKARR